MTGKDAEKGEKMMKSKPFYGNCATLTIWVLNVCVFFHYTTQIFFAILVHALNWGYHVHAKI